MGFRAFTGRLGPLPLHPSRGSLSLLWNVNGPSPGSGGGGGQERDLCVHCLECKQVYLNRGVWAVLLTCQHSLLRRPTCADCEIVMESWPLTI